MTVDEFVAAEAAAGGPSAPPFTHSPPSAHHPLHPEHIQTFHQLPDDTTIIDLASSPDHNMDEKTEFSEQVDIEQRSKMMRHQQQFNQYQPQQQVQYAMVPPQYHHHHPGRENGPHSPTSNSPLFSAQNGSQRGAPQSLLPALLSHIAAQHQLVMAHIASVPEIPQCRCEEDGMDCEGDRCPGKYPGSFASNPAVVYHSSLVNMTPGQLQRYLHAAVLANVIPPHLARIDSPVFSMDNVRNSSEFVPEGVQHRPPPPPPPHVQHPLPPSAIGQYRPRPPENPMRITDAQLILGLANGSIKPTPQQVDYIQRMINESSKLIWPIPIRDAKLPRRKLSKRFIHSREYISNNLNFRVLNFLSNFPVYQVPANFEALSLLPCRKCKKTFSVKSNELVACRGHCGQTFHQKCYGLQINRDTFYCKKDPCQRKYLQWKELTQESQNSARNAKRNNHRPKRTRSAVSSYVKPTVLNEYSPATRIRDRDRDRDRDMDNQVPVAPMRTCFDAWVLIERFFDPFLLTNSLKLLEPSDIVDLLQIPKFAERVALPEAKEDDPTVDASNEFSRIPIRQSFVWTVSFADSNMNSRNSRGEAYSADMRRNLWQDDVLPNRKFLSIRMTEISYALSLQICDEFAAQKRYLAGNSFFFIFPPSPYSGISGKFLDLKGGLPTHEIFEEKNATSILQSGKYSVSTELNVADIEENEDDDEISSELWLLRRELERVTEQNHKRKVALKEKISSNLVAEETVQSDRTRKLSILSQYVSLASSSKWSSRSKEDMNLIMECYAASRDKLYALSRKLEDEKISTARRRMSISRSSQSKGENENRQNHFDSSETLSFQQDFRTYLKDMALLSDELLHMISLENVDMPLNTLTKKTGPCSGTPPIEVNEFCFCRSTQLNFGDPIITCHFCERQFHSDCVNIVNGERGIVKRFICPQCTEETGFPTSFVTFEIPKRETRSSSGLPRVRFGDRLSLRKKRVRFFFENDVIEKLCGYGAHPVADVQENISVPSDSVASSRRNSVSSSSNSLKIVLQMSPVENSTNEECRSHDFTSTPAPSNAEISSASIQSSSCVSGASAHDSLSDVSLKIESKPTTESQNPTELQPQTSVNSTSESRDARNDSESPSIAVQLSPEAQTLGRKRKRATNSTPRRSSRPKQARFLSVGIIYGAGS